MRRICFVLKVRPDMVDEYRARHREVWPEMRQALSESGWHNYSIFLRPDGLLIGYLETDDFDAARAAMNAREVNQRWQEQMGDYFEGIDDQAPDAAMTPLAEVFHLD